MWEGGPTLFLSTLRDIPSENGVGGTVFGHGDGVAGTDVVVCGGAGNKCITYKMVEILH